MSKKENSSPSKIMTKLDSLLIKAEGSIQSTNNLDALEKQRVSHLGRKSKLTTILRSIKNLKPEDRGPIGSRANEIRNDITELIDNQRNKLREGDLNTKIENEKLDITLPGTKINYGHRHPVTQMQIHAEDIFMNMGFDVVYPYEVDDDYHIFESLNFPLGHPARDNWDTFSLTDNHMPIPHTSSMQNRILSSKKPPIRAVVPGRCFRNEATDARHEHTFFQFEGIYVDVGITFGHLLGTLKTFFSTFYNQDINVKFTPDFFPFVEPGGMMSLTCILCGGKGCEVCKKSGWLEILGCGMIHPNVLEMAGIDHNVYSGFAWGFGLERLIMLKYNIEDIRLFNSGKLEFIRQF